MLSDCSCCGAGTAADTEMTTNLIASQLELHRLNTGRLVPVATANVLLKQMLFRYQGQVSAALVLGGVDNSGSYIYSIHPHGSTDKLPYATMGSGSLAAMSVFESRWSKDMNEEDGKKLVRDAIAGGVFNDLGSGSNIDLCVIKKGSVDYLRGYEYANKKGERTVSSVLFCRIRILYLFGFSSLTVILRLSSWYNSRSQNDRSSFRNHRIRSQFGWRQRCRSNGNCLRVLFCLNFFFFL